jgi:hypothetical protein
MKKLSTRATLRSALVGVATAVLASGIAIGATAGSPPNHANRLEATFAETRVAVQDRTADLGIRQTISSGTGTLEGFGAATEIAAISRDVSSTPCGPGSSSTTILRRIVVPEGTLVVKTLGRQCPAPGGQLATGEYQVDGASSTGVFAGAWGDGIESTQVGPPPSGAITATYSGKLHLVQPLDD